MGGGDAEIKAALIETFLLPAFKSARFHRIINALTSEVKKTLATIGLGRL